MTRTYSTPLAFKQALEQRLKAASGSGPELSRIRQLLIFDRYLARITQTLDDAVVLKGGLVLELRLERARTTKDIDLRLMGSPDNVLERLQEAARLDLGDFLTFEIEADAHHPTMVGDGIRYEGMRYRAECRLAGKIFGSPFGVDVGVGDPIYGAPTEVSLNDTLGFAGIAPASVKLYPVVTHIAEKLHAYTMPRKRPNSRVKDLPDLALLASTGPLAASDLRAALEQTFTFRSTHEVPSALPPPPESWEKPYAAMARSDQLQWIDILALTKQVAAFLNPILGASSRSEGRWNPSVWAWTSA